MAQYVYDPSTGQTHNVAYASPAVVARGIPVSGIGPGAAAEAQAAAPKPAPAPAPTTAPSPTTTATHKYVGPTGNVFTFTPMPGKTVEETAQILQPGSVPYTGTAKAGEIVTPPEEPEKPEKPEKPEEPEKPTEPEPVTVSKEEIIAWLKQQPEYKNLPKDLQEDIIAYIDVLGIQDIETQKRILSSLNLAVSQADPYFAEIIRMFKDELGRAVGITTEDYESQQRDIQERIRQLQEDLSTGRERLTTDKQVELNRLQAQYDELEISKGIAGEDFASQEKRLKEQIKRIEEDLETGKGRLSVDEQAELARLGRRYEVDLENLREGAARAGLTFSSRRALAEERLEIEHEDIRESTKRTFQRQLQDLQMRAERGDMDAKRELEEYERQYGETVGRLTRQQEQYMGEAGYLATTKEAFRRKLEDLQTEARRGNVSAQNQIKDLERIYGRSIEELGRKAEQYLGTERLGALPGYAPLGGVRGAVEEEKLGDIMERARAYGGFL